MTVRTYKCKGLPIKSFNIFNSFIQRIDILLILRHSTFGYLKSQFVWVKCWSHWKCLFLCISFSTWIDSCWWFLWCEFFFVSFFSFFRQILSFRYIETKIRYLVLPSKTYFYCRSSTEIRHDNNQLLLSVFFECVSFKIKATTKINHRQKIKCSQFYAYSVITFWHCCNFGVIRINLFANNSI